MATAYKLVGWLLRSQQPQMTNMSPAQYFRGSGIGSFAGTYPSGITSISGVPTTANVLVQARAPGHPFDGVVVARTTSAVDGTWLALNVDPERTYTVLGQKSGQNDVAQSGVTPYHSLHMPGPAALFAPTNATRSIPLTVHGGEGPYTYAVTSGSLPTGVAISSGSLVSTTPTATPGDYTVTITATDARSNTVSKVIVISIVTFELVIVTSIPSGGTSYAVGDAVSESVTALYGRPPYAYAVDSGSLPTGLSLDAGTGAITGTASTAGSYTFNLSATDADGTSRLTGNRTASVRTKHAYWRVFITAYNNHPSLSEVEMAAATDGTNLCTGGTAIAGGYYGAGYEPAKAFDGSYVDPSWAANLSAPLWIGYQFASPVSILQMRLFGRIASGNQYPTAFRLEYSDDGTTWTTATTYTGQTSWAQGVANKYTT